MVTEHRFASPQTNVTKPNNQGRTKRYDCIPLPIKSPTASNPHPETRFPSSVDLVLNWDALDKDLLPKILWDNAVRCFGEP